MSCAIAIFVKTPALSPVKTRLWPGIGQDNAVELFEHSAAATMSVARRAKATTGIHPYWAVAEKIAVAQACWSDAPHIAQGEGGLGDRMARVYDRLRREHDGVMLIGADSPQMSANLLADAVAWLESNEARLVIGPATDGGFWLFGGNVDLPVDAWQRPRYSSPETSSEFRAAMQSHGGWLTLETLQDIDEVDDISAVRAALEQLPGPTDEQRALLELLERQWLATELLS
ncbi:MAG: TIGR04282 family arsenosugar biosynthesis glycosyltransferase [Dokdonella sp.]